MKNIYKVILLIFLVLLLAFLFRKGFENKVDPLWINTQNLVNTNISMLDENGEQLQKIYDSIHPQQKNVKVLKLINKPFLPTISWKKFNNLLYKVINEKKIVIHGVSGSGKTTIADKIALIIVGNENNIKKVTCSQGLDQDYNKQWIGYYNHDGFQPGELLTLFNTCEKNPNENYALIIDDFDKVHRSTFFGAAIWNELDAEDYENTIKGYDTQISIPKNLFLISIASPRNSNNFPLGSEDYRRLANGNPFSLLPNTASLKEYILESNNTPKVLDNFAKDSLTKQLYFLSKTNEIINKRIGESAVIGQWSGITKPLKKFDFNAAEDFVKSHLSKFENQGKLSDEDFQTIKHALHTNGKLKNSNFIATNFKKFVDLGLFSELSVAILVALFSTFWYQRSLVLMKRNSRQLLSEIKQLQTKYYTNEIPYYFAIGSLLSKKDEINVKSKNGELNPSQANFLLLNLNEAIDIIDFINGLDEKHVKLREFMKIVIADDDITQEEFDEHIAFLRENKSKINKETYKTVKQLLIKLFYKSKAKYGRIKI